MNIRNQLTIIMIIVMIALWILGLICLALWVYERIYMVRRKLNREPPQIPGGYPLIGHAHLLLTVKHEDTWKAIFEMADRILQIGGVGVLNIGPLFKGYLISDPEVSSYIMNEFPERDELYKVNEPWIGKGLFLAPAPLWHQYRKNTIRMLRFRMETIVGIFNENSKNFSRDLIDKSGKGPFDIAHLVALYNLETFCRTFFKMEVDKQKLSNYILAVEEWDDLQQRHVYQSLFRVQNILNAFGILTRQQEALKILYQLSSEIIEETRARRVKSRKQNGEVNTEENPIECVDILFELNEKGEIDDKLLQSEVNSLLFAALETTTASMCFAFELIGSYPEVQDKILAEVKEVLNDAENITYKDTQKMVYLEAVLNETMRIYPLISLFLRKLTRTVQFDNFTLLAGRRCMVYVPGVHRHPSWGPDAQEFRPERWLQPDTLPTNRAAFQSFGFGKRSCIGKTYAMLTMKVLFAQIIRNHCIKADHTKMKVKFYASIRPEKGHFISVEKRH